MTEIEYFILRDFERDVVWSEQFFMYQDAYRYLAEKQKEVDLQGGRRRKWEIIKCLFQEKNNKR